MDGTGDFLSLGMSGGSVEFRFDTGAGPTVIRSAPVALDEWHVARIKRVKRKGDVKRSIFNLKYSKHEKVLLFLQACWSWTVCNTSERV